MSTAEAMNAKERLLSALRLQPVDRVPVAAVATGITVEMMNKTGILWPEAHKYASLLAGLAESIFMYTDTEAIKLPFDMVVEVEALGAKINYRTIDTTPTEVGHLYQRIEDIDIPNDFLDRGRIPVVLEATRNLRQKYNFEVPVITSIVGPFGLATKLFGYDDFFIWLIDHPEWVHQIMDEMTDLAINYANAQEEAGADIIIIGDPTSTGDLISPETYRDFILPYHKRLCSAITVPDIMHICGKSTGHIPHIIESGTTCYNFDEGVELETAVDLMKGKTAIAGSVPTLSVLLNGTPLETYHYSQKCLEAGVDILTPGCALAPHTPIANINAMARAALEWSDKEKVN
jgi:[methyl-Co(III) methanol-specific corrinoid protein]:coenzyme M methyltransferase